MVELKHGLKASERDRSSGQVSLPPIGTVSTRVMSRYASKSLVTLESRMGNIILPICMLNGESGFC